MKKAGKGNIETNLARLLFRYRITPHSTTGHSPAELLMGRRLQSHLDQLLPSRIVPEGVRRGLENQKLGHDRRTRHRTFSVNKTVFVRIFGCSPMWLPGTVLQQIVPLSYKIELRDGRVIHRHIDHLHSRLPTVMMEDTEDEWNHPALNTPASTDTTTGSVSESRTLRRSQQSRQPPDRYRISVTF